MGLSLYQRHVESWKNCTRCPAHLHRKHTALVRGSLPCDVLFVGEAPGESEDVLGKPFVGPAGHLFDHIVKRSLPPSPKHLLLQPKDCDCNKDRGGCPVCDGGLAYCVRCKGGESELVGTVCRPYTTAFTNVVACIPRDDGVGKLTEPDDEQVKACAPRVTEVVVMAQPRLVVCVGKVAETWLTPGMRDSLDVDPTIPRVTVLHPAFVLRSNLAQQGLLIQKCVVTIRTALEELK